MLNFLYPILDSIGEGPFVRQVLKYCLRGFAGVVALVGLISLIATLKLAFMQGVPTSVSIAALVVACLFIAACICQIQIFLYRASKIQALQSTRFPVFPAAVQLVRLAGEVAATTVCTLGLAAFIASVLAGQEGGFSELLPGPFGRFSGSGFSGFVVLLMALGVGFSFLVVAYVMAEALQMSMDAAEDIRFIADGQPEAAAVSNTMLASAPRACPNCLAGIPAGNDFCTQCGTHVGSAAKLAGASA